MRQRVISGRFETLVKDCHRRGDSNARIVLVLEGEGLSVSERSVSRFLDASGLRKASAARATTSRADVPEATHGDSELEVIRENLSILRPLLHGDTPGADRARISSEIRSLLARRDFLETRARSSEGANESTIQTADRVREMLTRHSAVKRASIETVLLRIPEEHRGLIRAALEGRPLPQVEPATPAVEVAKHAS